jgi:RNA polymerase sigma-70 factor (ECF subfamily)
MQNSAEQIADQMLVLEAQGGRREAFERLVARWQKRLWAHAFHLTGHADAAWDITQESWLDVVRGLPRLQDPAKFGAWAYRIVSNEASDWMRRNRRPSEPAVEPEAHHSLTGEQAQRETVQDVHSILRLLPAPARVVLSLFYLEGFGVTEIARILGTPEGTVKSRLHAARAEFRAAWESLVEPSRASPPAHPKGMPK